MTTLGELRKQLNKLAEDFPESTQIISAKDPEGNAYSPLSEVFTGHYLAYNTWSGEVWDTPQDDSFIPVIVLKPTN
jgi:hypothetical protein